MYAAYLYVLRALDAATARPRPRNSAAEPAVAAKPLTSVDSPVLRSGPTRGVHPEWLEDQMRRAWRLGMRGR